jgi:hypothetical protein
VVAAVLVALAAAPVAAAPRGAARGGPREPRLLGGDEASQRVARVTQEIAWHDSLAVALGAARAQDRPVFWVHMLGQLAGDT